jgi:hypothetical protein
MLRHVSPSLRYALAGVLLASISGLLTACSDDISDTDIAFVTAGTPSQFQSLRMYGAVPNSAPIGGGSARTTGRLRQACQATILAAGREERVTVILENVPGSPFDLDATRTSDGWNVTSDGLTPPSTDPVAFRTRFATCVDAIRDKFAAEPEKAPFHK